MNFRSCRALPHFAAFVSQPYEHVAAHDEAWREFHVSRGSRERYDFDHALFSTNGNVIFANFHAARLFAAKMNAKRDLQRFPQSAVKASHIHAMGLLDEVLHFVIARYRQEKNPTVLETAIRWLETNVGAAALDAALLKFVEEFPPVAVFRKELTARQYLGGESGGVPNRQLALEELIMLWLSNANPALQPYEELFSDQPLSKLAYPAIITQLHAFFATQPGFGPNNQNLLDLLRAPALAHPDSIVAQLEFVLRRWQEIAPEFFQRLLMTLDFIKEEEKAIFSGPGPAQVLEFRRGSGGSVGMDEPERFSPDLHWMPNVVLLAKNVYVWLDQLSKEYGRHIYRLDQVPDEELDTLAARGFNGLWLIGLWERSRASQRIKQMCGNPDAVASAYSLYSYDIAHALGGYEAMQNLRERAAQRGIRMASDMVPNHMAIDSRWVIEHPDWFLSLPHAPFPTYTFNGPNVSDDERVAIYVDDGYYSKTDAAVVFKRVDQWSGDTRYIYHGNDGTSMPWNDTAQLDYLQAEVREAVIQTILHVARQFPIIRFDAAMTLAKRHYQRLWFPEPGTGGDIPSRAEHGLTADEFNAAFPEEFWREVVDRVAQEAPDTLLLAEAFWLMEGFFVRTLGMHRVYNSAFMNMMRDEENAKYRLVLKNILEFEPEILKRFVNFMNNPDEDTAVDRFGKGDKYFGICTVMATLPGLPMFGHGQIEGYAEKYGMEYPRAYWNEQPDQYLVARHEREIFPLLHRRHLFAESDDFVLYDFWTQDGTVDENVFAYSNRSGEQSSLVLYNNRYGDAIGWIRTSVGIAQKNADGSRSVKQCTIGEALKLNKGTQYWTLFRDHNAGLEYIRSSDELQEKGLFAHLQAYGYHVFLDFREVRDTTGRYAQVAAQLNGHGVPDIDRAVRELWVLPVLEPFRHVADAALWRQLLNIEEAPPEAAHPEEAVITEEEVLEEAAVTAVAVAESEPVSLKANTGKAAATTGKAVATTANAPADATLAASPINGQAHPPSEEIQRQARVELEERFRIVVSAVSEFCGKENDPKLEAQVVATTMARVDRVLQTAALPDEDEEEYSVHLDPEDTLQINATLLGWTLVQELGQLANAANPAGAARPWLDEWLLADTLGEALRGVGLHEPEVAEGVRLIKLLTAYSTGFATLEKETLFEWVSLLISDADAKVQLGVNRYNDIVWLNHEGFESLLEWLLTSIAVLQPKDHEAERRALIAAQLINAAEESGYQVVKFLENVRKLKTARV